MHSKIIFTGAVCAAIALSSLTASPVQAKDTGALIAGVALGVLGASIAHHHHKHGAPYQKHPGVSPEENAIGLCMHRTKTAMSNQGYYAVDFEQTLSYETNADGIDLIDLEVARSKDSNDQRSTIKAHCAIQNDAVVNFRYSTY
ncbi:hypothetical protein Q5Y75_02100 [Ruegeria sp. 2205SS24-7]|uniref:hypothetical protein n=1 Tax=Ruegeria discodermiae TaxID=3064389 RepID=UPI002741DCD3|nr:hypothetical protein [Ruegeria sp. 2205SS24-7]MDP5216000.1 hypothetical protein [Ruegeria sp. 2205SS24-7]